MKKRKRVFYKTSNKLIKLIFFIFIFLILSKGSLSAITISLTDYTDTTLKNKKNLDLYKTEDSINKKSYEEVEKIINDNYIKGMKDIDKKTDNIKDLFNQLDNYSHYYTKSQLTELLEGLDSDSATVGIEVKKDNKALLIADVKLGSSAYKEKLKPGTKIIAINGKDMTEANLEEVLKELSGKRGTKVNLRLERDGNIIEKKLIRNSDLYEHVSSKVVQGIGYVRISKFTKNSFETTKSHLEDMKKMGVEKIILDLRANPGGYLDQAVRVSELFVPKGPIVHVDYSNKGRITYSSFNDKLLFKKLCVLVDEKTASAAEIVTGAIKDRKAGTIIGKKTYGKGLIQEIIGLKTGDGMKITVAEYFSPNNKKIDTLGITPHIVVENTKQDYQLLKAVNLLSK